MTKLIQCNFEYKRKAINVTLGIRSAFGQSNLQVDYRRAHPKQDQEYTITCVGLIYTISYSKLSKTGGMVETLHRLKKNHIRCNSELCEVKCLDCPSVPVCAHTYTCDCQQYGHKNLCVHSHVLAMSPVSYTHLTLPTIYSV